MWHVPTGRLPTRPGRKLPGGIYESTVVAIAACESAHTAGSRCPEPLVRAATEVLAQGGILTRGPHGHLVGCFVGKNPVDAANRSVQCALTVQAESEKHGLRTFTGVNTGPVIVKNRQVSGAVIKCAEALAFSLRPHTVVLSPATFYLTASHFECYGTSPIGLWGEQTEVPETVYVATGPKTATSWKHRLDDHSVPLVGRKEELALLCQFWEETKSEKGALGLAVHLIGEPGAGKSRLLQAFLAKVRREDPNTTVLKLAGSNYGSRPGLLIQEFIAECTREGITLVKNAGRTRHALTGGLENHLPRSLAARVGLVSQSLFGLRSNGPVLIVIDDVHWADRDSVTVFERAFQSLPSGVMAIVSYRPSASWLASSLKAPDTRLITLGPLNEEEARKIGESHSGGGGCLSESAWRELWKRSKGNPLYVEEAVKLLSAETGSPYGNFLLDSAGDGSMLPDTIAGLLLARIRRWADRELRDLRMELSIQGCWSLRHRLARLERQLNDWLDRLETQKYLDRSEIAECLHELEQFESRIVELCLMGGLSRPLTTRLGEALSRLYEGSYSDHYRHLRRPGRVPQNRILVGTQALRAGKRAVQRGRLREAARFFRIAEEMLPHDYPPRRGLLEKAGDVNLLLARTNEAARVYQKALREEHFGGSRNEEITLKLLAARLLSGEQVDLTSYQWKDGARFWYLALLTMAALLSGDGGAAISYAKQAKRISFDWVTESCSWLVEAFVELAVGNLENAAACCAEATERMHTGGVSMLSLGLHFVLSHVTGGPLRARHKRTLRFIAKQLGVTPLLWSTVPHPKTKGERS